MHPSVRPQLTEFGRAAERIVRPALAAWQSPSGAVHLFGLFVVGTLLAAATGVVYVSGGTRFAYVHTAYVPILIAAFLFGLRGGIAAGFLAGLCVGPFMPLDVEAGSSQSTLNWLSRTFFFVGIGGLAGLLCSTLRRQLEDARQHGFHDALTKLPNTAQLLDDLKVAIGHSEERGSLTVIAVGLAGFASTVSTFGLSHGDRLRLAAAERLLQNSRDGLQLYDLGGGRFATVLEDSLHVDAMEVGQAFAACLGKRFNIEGVPLLSEGHFGVARYPQHAEEPLGLVRASIAALDDSLDRGRPHAIFDEERDRERRNLVSLIPSLQLALQARDQLALHFQPKVSLETGTCMGVEALLRWQHPELGMIPPARFVPLAENTALIRPLTERVLELAVCQSMAWHKAGLDLTIGINVSVRNLEDKNFYGSLRDLIRFHKAVPHLLQLEITETALMHSPNEINDRLLHLRELGVSVALDDFGTGYSSLACLRDLAVDQLKLDQSFIRHLLFDRRAQVIVSKTIETAHSLGFSVVAEGIEERAVYERLREMSCDFGQGFLIAHPLSPAELEVWLAVRKKQTFAPAIDQLVPSRREV